MIKTQILCDICERPIPYHIVGGYEGNYDAYIDRFRTKECDTRELFPHLCKSCADKLDIAFRHMREETRKQAELAAKYAKINKERKEKKGSFSEALYKRGLGYPVPWFNEESVL